VAWVDLTFDVKVGGRTRLDSERTPSDAASGKPERTGGLGHSRPAGFRTHVGCPTHSAGQVGDAALTIASATADIPSAVDTER
jgi:hypothetical protein